MAENNVKDQLLTIKAGLPPRSDAGLFGLDVPEELAQLVLLGVPWEATTSYGRGTAQAPAALVPASHQLDLFDHDFGEPFLCGIALKQLDDVGAKNQQASAAAKKVIAAWESGDNPEKTCAKELALVNGESQAVDEHVYAAAKGLLGSGKIVGVVGGDHSSPFGLLRAIQEQFHDRE